jgi:dephospho-CoA kinase
MLNVALTGNVAAGKTTVGTWFAQWGATLIDADELVRQVQAPGSAVLAAIAEKFGPAMIREDGALDRARLRRRVMADQDALAALNSIVHPAVQRMRAQRASEAALGGDCILVNDIPLLFEVLDPTQFDLVVLVDAPVDVRRQRLVTERRLPPDEADRLLASQMDARDKRGRSDFVIDNAGSLDDLEQASWDVWRAVRERAAHAMGVRGSVLLTVLAHPTDETFAIGGTLARYAEAGAEVHVVTATAGGASVTELHRACEILGVSDVHPLEYSDGELPPDSSEGASTVEALLRQHGPAVVITVGPDGLTGHPDHKAVHRWTLTAWQACGSRGLLYYITYPQHVAEPLGRLASRPAEEIVAALDIRPWQDVKRAAIAAHASQRFPFELDAPETVPLFEREWFADVRSGTASRIELFSALDTD